MIDTRWNATFIRDKESKSKEFKPIIGTNASI